MSHFEQSREELEEFLEFIEEDLENVRRVVEAVEDQGIDAEFLVHPKSESAEESVREGLKLEQIVKTLVFKGDEIFAVLCPGDRRVDIEKLEELRGAEVDMAEPGEVREATGYPVGAVSPFDLEIEVFMEEELLQHEFVRPAAGSRILGAEIPPRELREAVDAEKVKVVE